MSAIAKKRLAWALCLLAGAVGFGPVAGDWHARRFPSRHPWSEER